MVTPSNRVASPLHYHTTNNPLTDQELLSKLRNFDGRSLELVNLFTELESNDPEVVKRATHTLQFLIHNGLSLLHLVLHSLPLWPVDGAAIRAIALQNSECPHPTLRERGLMACSYLVTHSMREGYELAAILAAKKLPDPDDHIQHEGLKFFMLLMQRYKTDLPAKELALAIPLALRLLQSETHLWLEGNRFFELLIKHGTKQDILLAKQSILQACASRPHHQGYQLCDTIVTSHHPDIDLLSIPLEAIVQGSKSKDRSIQAEIWSLCWRLLYFVPEISIETIVECILIESKKENPDIKLLARLQELTGMDSSNSGSYRGLESKLLLQHADTLLDALSNLSNCKNSYLKKEAAEIKNYFEAKLYSMKNKVD